MGKISDRLFCTSRWEWTREGKVLENTTINQPRYNNPPQQNNSQLNIAIVTAKNGFIIMTEHVLALILDSRNFRFVAVFFTEVSRNYLKFFSCQVVEVESYILKFERPPDDFLSLTG